MVTTSPDIAPARSIVMIRAAMKAPTGEKSGLAQQLGKHVLVETHYHGFATHNGWCPQITRRTKHSGHGDVVCLGATGKLAQFLALGNIELAGRGQQVPGVRLPKLLTCRNLFLDTNVIVPQELGGSGAAGSARAVIIPINFFRHVCYSY